MAERSPKGPYTVWYDSGEGWSFNDYPTLQEAVASDKFSSGWVVMKPVEWMAVEKPPLLKPDPSGAFPLPQNAGAKGWIGE